MPKSVRLEDLRKLFNEHSDDPMYGGYKVLKKHSSYFQKYLSEKIDLKKYDYFLSCYQVEQEKDGIAKTI